MHVQTNTESVQCFSIKYHDDESLYLEIKTEQVFFQILS